MTWRPRHEYSLEEIESVLESLLEWTRSYDPIEEPSKHHLASFACALLATAVEVEGRRTEAEAYQSIVDGNPNPLAHRLSYWYEVRSGSKTPVVNSQS
jgi:hypothetical protein